MKRERILRHHRIAGHIVGYWILLLITVIVLGCEHAFDGYHCPGLSIVLATMPIVIVAAVWAGNPCGVPRGRGGHQRWLR